VYHANVQHHEIRAAAFGRSSLEGTQGAVFWHESASHRIAALTLQLEVLNQEHLILCARDDAPSTEREMGVASKPLRFVHLGYACSSHCLACDVNRTHMVTQASKALSMVTKKIDKGAKCLIRTLRPLACVYLYFATHALAAQLPLSI
jgi:hypothetical protein